MLIKHNIIILWTAYRIIHINIYIYLYNEPCIIVYSRLLAYCLAAVFTTAYKWATIKSLMALIADCWRHTFGNTISVQRNVERVQSPRNTDIYILFTINVNYHESSLDTNRVNSNKIFIISLYYTFNFVLNLT
jgi:hypothetical protein